MHEAILRNFSSVATLISSNVDSPLEAENLIILAVSLTSLILASVTATIASKKDGGYFKWFVAGGLCSIVALPMAIRKQQPVAPLPLLKHCPNCPEQVSISALVCESCDYNFLSGRVGHRHKLLPHYEPRAHDASRRPFAYGA